MNTSPRLRFFGVCILLLLGAPWTTIAAEKPDAVKKYALLVGCTQYPERPLLRTLRGPANDVPMWTRILTNTNGFQFPAAHVTQLVGWPEQPERRPTRANIVKGFEDLVARSGPGVQIFILLSGHGMQIPLAPDRDPLDPKHFKPDGLEEVFLPADVKNSDGGVENVLLDYQIGAYLDRMRDRKASVWIVFDCCHAGDMTRGGAEDVREVNRVADPALFGITREQIDAAGRRVAEALKKAGTDAARLTATRERVVPSTKEQGGLTAFFAAQSFEEAPELPQPPGAPQVPENYYGMLSYTIAQCLEQRQGPLTYRDLAHLVAVRYRAVRGTRPPTPFAEGDLDREVLGLQRWPQRSDFVLTRGADGLRVAAGALHGLTPGSILALHPPVGRDAKEVLGYVRVDEVTATSAKVTPCPFEDRPALAVEKVEAGCRCEVVRRDYGDLRIKLFADDAAVLQDALAKMTEELRALVAPTAREADAEWLLRAVSPQQADASYHLPGLKGPHVLLLQGAGKRTPLEEKPSARKVFGVYPAADARELTAALERDLPKIGRWQNIWRIAGGVQSEDGGKSYGLTMEIREFPDPSDAQGKPLRNGVLRDGQKVGAFLKNDGDDPLWVTVLYLDANLAVRQAFPREGPSRAVRPADDAIRFLEATMSTAKNSAGLEGMIVFAIPQKAQNEAPDFSFLEQEPLAVAEPRERGARPIPKTPFGKLLTAAVGKEAVRGVPAGLATTPAVISQSWILLNKP